MTNIFRQRIVWTGFPGGPGLTTLYFSSPDINQTAIETFLTAVATILPPDVTVTIQPGGDVLEDTTGVLTGSWAGTVKAPIVGTAPSNTYAAPVGLLIRWETATVRSGSRLRGRSYIVPMYGAAFQADGSISPTILADVGTVASDFVGAVTPLMVVWQRPRAASTAYTDGKGRPHAAVAARGGSTGVVIGSSIPDLAVVLRSRRD